MKLVVQSVSNASVEVDNKIVGKIDEGLMVLVGFGANDTTAEADFLAKKLLKLRIFEDDEDRMNLSVLDISGEILLIPQFTLYGTTKKNRPSFHRALKPEKASKLFDYYCDKCAQSIHVERGVFGAHMNVSLLNNGPVTILLEKEYEQSEKE